jgi:hypothetical protein
LAPDGPVAGSFEHGNENSVSIKAENFWTVERLLASEEGLYYKESVTRFEVSEMLDFLVIQAMDISQRNRFQ